MLSQILGLGSRRLFAISLVLAGALLGILLIILWQLGVFDSPPPPAALQSAVESIRQEDQQQQVEAQTQQPMQAAEEATEQEQPAAQPQEQTSEPQEQTQQQAGQSAQDADDQPQQEQQQQQQSAAGYGYGSQQDDSQSDESDEQPAQQQAQQETPQQAAQESAQESAQQQSQTQEQPTLDALAGTWTISDRGTSFVGYRIGEELANIGTATAVGRTSDIVATLEFDGTTITNVTIEADLRTLRSDQGFRDSALRTRGLESDIYPFATFVLLEPIPIDALPVAGETIDVMVNGTLELHGVTNPVSIALQGQYVDGLVVVAGSTEITLLDYDIEAPTGFRVLSIDEVGIMEFELVFERAQ